MAKRDTSAGSKRRATSPMAGKKQTPAQKAAAAANLAKGRASKEEARRKAKEQPENTMTAGERWAMLLDGTLTVRDLDDEEIRKMRVRSVDGTFNGAGRRLPSHLAVQFQQEAIRRATEMFRTAAPRAVERLLEIADDPDAKHSDVIKALSLIMDRGLGKVPETLRVEGASAWDVLGAEAAGLDRDLADLAGEAGILDDDLA